MAAAQRGGDRSEIVRAVQDKRPVPEIDFSLHTMEDGSQVSTQERVCKGRDGCFAMLSHHRLTRSCRCSSPSVPSPHPRTVHLST